MSTNKPNQPHKWQHLIDAQEAGKACQKMGMLGDWINGPWSFDSEHAKYRLTPNPEITPPTENQMTTPHKHADLIKLWADGAKVQFESVGRWFDETRPAWIEGTNYRVKPETHKWQHLINAQKAGKPCQMFLISGLWLDGHFDFDSVKNEYRLKTETIRFRNFLWRSADHPGLPQRPLVFTCTEDENTEDDRSKWSSFVRWIGDWQEVEL